MSNSALKSGSFSEDIALNSKIRRKLTADSASSFTGIFICQIMLRMLRNICLPVCLAFALSQLSAQNPGCDGVRYKNDVFTQIKMTTVTYAPSVTVLGGAVNLQMDVYEPDSDNIAVRPVVILAHGGSFLFGDRTMMASYCQLLAKKGYVAASIDYRLFPFFPLGFPDSLEIFDTAVKAVGDMRAAVRYFREDASTGNQFRADTAHIFIGGYSAGAVAALHCAYLDESDDIPAFLQTIINNNGGLDGVSGTASNKTYSASNKAVVNMSGGLYRSAWVDPTEVPLVSIHGTADETVPFVSGLAANIAYLQGSYLVHQRANEIGLWNSLHVVPGGGHTDIYDNASFQPHLDTFWVNATSMLETITCSTVAVKEPWTWINNWSVQPNPAMSGNSVRLAFPLENPAETIRMFDLSGKMVLTLKLSGTETDISTAGLPAGAYVIEPVSFQQNKLRFEPKVLIINQ